MATQRTFRRWLGLAGGLTIAVSGCAAPPPVPAPLAADHARIWFYRAWEPSESLNLADIDVNGGYFGSVGNGGVFYRDVLPGHYHIAPASFVPNSNEDRNVELAPGQQVYVKILSLVSWGSDDTAGRNIERDAFYAWVIPPAVAQAEIARDRNGI